jgi:hypothetical protein
VGSQVMFDLDLIENKTNAKTYLRRNENKDNGNNYDAAVKILTYVLTNTGPANLQGNSGKGEGVSLKPSIYRSTVLVIIYTERNEIKSRFHVIDSSTLSLLNISREALINV